MDHRTFKGNDEISLLGFGNMRLPLAQDGSGQIDYPAAKALLDAAMAGGVNYYDTAWGYHEGTSEEFVGKALAAYPRGSYYLATKLPMWVIDSREKALEVFHEQLRRCNTDYFDFYLFHAMDDERYDTLQKLQLWELADGLRKEGKIRNLGFSFHGSVELLQRMCKDYAWDFAQLQLNYIDWDFQDAKGQYETLRSHGIPCVVMEPVRGGRLADLGPEANALLKQHSPKASIASWAMRWLASLDNVLCVLSGMHTMQQVQDNLATFSPLKPLDEREKALLNEAAGIFKKVATIPCTACRYCMPCPAGVDIPGMLALANACAFDGSTFGLRERYPGFDAAQNAGNCVACGACEAACPQSLPISKLLHKLHTDATG